MATLLAYNPDMSPRRSLLLPWKVWPVAMAITLSLWPVPSKAAGAGDDGAASLSAATAPSIKHLSVPDGAATRSTAAIAGEPSEPDSSGEALPIPEYKEPSLLPIPASGSLADALAFTPAERDILFSVRDGDGQLDTAALYVLLRRAMMLPDTPQTLAEADPIHAANLWKDPARYRGQLIRLEANYAGKSIDWSADVTPSVWWGAREVYAVYAYVPGTSEPVIVFLTEKPPETIPAKLEIVGFFYKLLDEPSAFDPSRRGLYPVLVAKNVQRQTFAMPEMSGALGVVMGLAAVGLIAWIVLRRRNRRLAVALHRRHVRPALAQEAPQEPDGVDEELQRQVEQFKTTREE